MENATTAAQTKEQAAKESKLREIRFKPWEECDDSERVEKLKMAISDMQFAISNLSVLHEKIAQLQNHSHNEKTGEILVPLKENRNGLMPGGLSVNRNILS